MKKLATERTGFIANVFLIGIVTVLTWTGSALAYSLFFGFPADFDHEGAAAFVYVILPLISLLDLGLIYTLSILDRTILCLGYITIAVFLGNIATIVMLNYVNNNEGGIFLAHLLTIVCSFLLWHLVNGKPVTAVAGRREL